MAERLLKVLMLQTCLIRRLTRLAMDSLSAVEEDVAVDPVALEADVALWVSAVAAPMVFAAHAPRLVEPSSPRSGLSANFRQLVGLQRILFRRYHHFAPVTASSPWRPRRA